MEAIYWLVGIAASIYAAHWIGRYFGTYIAKRAGSSIALFWLLWTLGGSSLFVGYALGGPLVIVQLAIIAVAFFYSRRLISSHAHHANAMNKAEKKINSLQVQIDVHEATIDRMFHDYSVKTKTSDISQILHTTRQHRAKLVEVLQNASSHAIILSGWATDYVVDRDFLSLITSRLENGVDIYIGYGYTRSGDKQPSKDYEVRAKRRLEQLQLKARDLRLSGNLMIRFFPNHAKVLIRDSHTMVIGSFNWLSNNGRSKNEEISVVLANSAVVKQETNMIMKHFDTSNRKIA